MEIDNFDTFMKRLRFSEKTDRYIIHILRRPKDCKEIFNAWGPNVYQGLLKTYYVDSFNYLDRKRDAIKELCTTNRARAYILPQVRNNFECLLNLGEKVLETVRMDNFSVKPERLLRSAYCGYHKSRDEKWVLDLDKDDMTEYVFNDKGYPEVKERAWTAEEVLAFVKRQLEACGKSSDEAYLVKTRSGSHVISSPFDLQKAVQECSLLFEGERNVVSEVVWTGPGEYELKYKKIVGWLHKDGMSLLYMNID